MIDLKFCTPVRIDSTAKYKVYISKRQNPHPKKNTTGNFKNLCCLLQKCHLEDRPLPKRKTLVTISASESPNEFGTNWL